MSTGNNDPQKKRGNIANLKPFKKGQSGNPSGQSTAANELRRALEAGSERAGERVLELVESKDEDIALAASKFVVDHVKGKAQQSITGADGAPLIPGFDLSSLTVEQIKQLEAIRAAAKKKP